MRLLRKLCPVALAVLILGGISLAEDKPAAAPNPPVEGAKVKAAPAPMAEAPAKAPSDLSGYWSGTWLSCHDGHSGPLNGTFTKIDEDHYCVDFDGQFWGLFPFRYQVVLSVTDRQPGSLTMSGSSNLGLLLGDYHYQATVTESDFQASYCSKLDHGVFSLTRCACR